MNQGSRAPGRCVLLAEEVWGSALHAMRSIARYGGETAVVTSGSGASIFRRSRWCDHAVDISAQHPAEFNDRVRGWAESHLPGDDPIAVIPLSDRHLEWLVEARDAFPDRFRLSIPEVGVARRLLDKDRQFQLAERSGCAPPRWVTVRQESDLERLGSLSAPVAVRPTGWNAAGDEYFKLIVVDDDSALESTVASRLRAGAELIVQEFVDEPASAVEFAIVWRSRTSPRAEICTGRKLAQSGRRGGVMALGEAVDLPDVAAAARRFVDASGFVGLGGLEVIRSGGSLRFIEFNPRLEAIHFLATRAGVDTVVLEYLELLGRPVPSCAPQTAATAWVGSAWIQRLVEDRSAWSDAIRSRAQFARSPGRVRAVWSVDDPLPGLAVAGRIINRAVRPSRGGGT